MTEVVLVVQSMATSISDLLLCIGTVAFIWIVYMEDGL